MKTIKCPKGHGSMDLRKVRKHETFRGVELDFKAEAYVCPRCGLEAGTIESAGEIQRAVSEAYRKKQNLLTGKEIRLFRKDRGMTQQELADRMRVGVASVKRWETGMIQSKAMDHILRVHLQNQGRDDVYSGNREFSLPRIKLVIRTFERFLGKRLLKKTDKMLFAAKYLWYADMLAFRYLGRSMTGATYAALPYGPQLNNYRDLVDEIKRAEDSLAEPLTEDEVGIVKRILRKFPSEQMVYHAAHREKMMQDIRTGDLIPYSKSKDIHEA